VSQSGIQQIGDRRENCNSILDSLFFSFLVLRNKGGKEQGAWGRDWRSCPRLSCMLTGEEFVGPLILLKDHIEYSRKRDLIRMPETISLLYNEVFTGSIF